MRCEACGSAATTEIVFAAGDGLLAVPKVQCKKLFYKYSKLSAYACTDCGAVFRIRLEQPEKFKPFVDYSGGVQ